MTTCKNTVCINLNSISSIGDNGTQIYTVPTQFKNINMKKIIEEIDFLWKGDKDMLITMWMCILLALGVLTELGFNIYFTFFN